MRYIYIKNTRDHKQGDIVEISKGFWTMYYLEKGIIRQYQIPQETKAISKKKAKGGKK